MKSIKMALLAGAALAVTAAGAQADDLEALKAQIETLNARVAAMEAAPAVPAGYQLLAISEGNQVNVPGLETSNRDRFMYGDKATVISVMPTADAPAGATITWSGFTRAGLVYSDTSGSLEVEQDNGSGWNAYLGGSEDDDYGYDNDLDVLGRGEIKVAATTDTAVGEVGVMVSVRANFDGVSGGDVSVPLAWGYWAMTPELTFGGGYAGALANIGYGQDGAGSYVYTDAINFNPGDTSQLRLTYASGPFTAAISLEDASASNGIDGGWNGRDNLSDDTDAQLGLAGELKYSGDSFSAELAGGWRDIDEDEVPVSEQPFHRDASWQVGAGVGFSMGDLASVSLAAAMGEGPAEAVDNDGIVEGSYDWNNQWWGVTGLLSFNMTDEIHAEIGAGYKKRDFDDVELVSSDYSASYDKWVVGAGLYYNPVDQLTIGLEGSYSEATAELLEDNATGSDYRATLEQDQVIVDLVSVWRF